MDITAHIRELLFGHDCVIIPGFGGFIGNYTPARIDKVNGIMHPPVKRISFNRNLNHNDGLLIKKISATSGMNYGDTRRMVEEFVSDLKRKLERGEKVVFEHIGIFVNNHEGNLQFEPEENVNYHLDSFGLESFQCQPLGDYDVRKRIIRTDIVSRKYSIRKYLWRAAVLIPFAVAVVTVSLNPDFLKAKVETTTMNPLANAEFEHNKIAIDEIEAGKADESITSADTAVSNENVTDEAANVAETAPEPSIVETSPVITEKSSYYIITGSFQSEENAGKQVAQLQAEGFNPEVVSIGNGFYRVCAMECPDLTTAVAKKDSILGKFPGAWISRKK